jgi:hypothetical protein
LNQLIKSNLTFCVVCVFTLQIDEWCVHNRLFNAYFEDKFKRTPDIKVPLFPTNFAFVTETLIFEI